MATDIRSIVEAFANQVVEAVEADSRRRVQGAIAAAFGGELAGSRGPGRPARAASTKRRPKQLCPVPGCTGLAAPVFGMVCSKHKDMSKTKIAEYRAQRRAL